MKNEQPNFNSLSREEIDLFNSLKKRLTHLEEENMYLFEQQKFLLNQLNLCDEDNYCQPKDSTDPSLN